MYNVQSSVTVRSNPNEAEEIVQLIFLLHILEI